MFAFVVVGHGEWWRRHVEHAVATANGGAELQVRLQHLHELLKQPYDEIDKFSPSMAAGLLFCIATSVHGIARLTLMPAPDCSAAFGSSDCWRGVLSFGGAVISAAIGVLFFPMFLFFLGTVGDSFERTKKALLCPKVRVQRHRPLFKDSSVLHRRVVGGIGVHTGAPGAAAAVWQRGGCAGGHRLHREV